MVEERERGGERPDRGPQEVGEEEEEGEKRGGICVGF